MSFGPCKEGCILWSQFPGGHLSSICPSTNCYIVVTVHIFVSEFPHLEVIYKFVSISEDWVLLIFTSLSHFLPHYSIVVITGIVALIAYVEIPD
ncbi:hypothetical protein B0H13DRAFT_2365039 [Mycena leptocephala]|nr:hypothetical protein B0H13DRAFT_2365039 [Mycena leptocephala]